MNIPNILTLIRLFLIPIFVLVFFTNESLLYPIIIFIIAGITDVADGYIARKYNKVTKAGIVLDPIADKLMLITVLLCSSYKDFVPYWLPLVVIIKELIMITGGVLLYNKDYTVIPANIFGKIATSLFYVSVFILYFNNNIGVYFLYGSVLTTLIAFFTYFLNYIKIKNSRKKKIRPR